MRPCVIYTVASSCKERKKGFWILSSNIFIECLNSQNFINPVSPDSDQHPISPNNDTAWSNIQIIRRNEMITKDDSEMYRSLSKFWINLGFWETAQVLMLAWGRGRYFSLRAKCWLRGGVGGQFSRLSPKLIPNSLEQ